MRHIKLTGREVSVVRAIGFTSSAAGAEIQEFTHMELEDVADTLNSLMSAGFVESEPYYEQVEIDVLATTMFELNPAYVHDIKGAFNRR